MKTSEDTPDSTSSDDAVIGRFVTAVLAQGGEHYRDLPWRRTRDPYAVLVSEVMLQQTQVPRVLVRWEEWLADFPTLDALAAAPLEAVLRAWQGLGYNRRAVALKRTAEQLVAQREADGVAAGTPTTLPANETALRALPGIGPATAAGVRAFAFGLPGIYLETNVRTVVLHELFVDREGVSDREIEPLLRAALGEAQSRGIGPREWYYAMLDYGCRLKRTVPNPSRRSAHHTRQSAFEGSHRQKRAHLLRAVIANPGESADSYATELSDSEVRAGREPLTEAAVAEILESLSAEGFLICEAGRWLVR